MKEYEEYDIDSIKYFHEEKGDIGRLGNWEDIRESVYRDFPELRKAYEDYIGAERILNIVVKNIEFKG